MHSNWQRRGDMFWVWCISRCCNVARSWYSSWKYRKNMCQYFATLQDLDTPPENIEKTHISILQHHKILIHIFTHFLLYGYFNVSLNAGVDPWRVLDRLNFEDSLCGCRAVTCYEMWPSIQGRGCTLLRSSTKPALSCCPFFLTSLAVHYIPLYHCHHFHLSSQASNIGDSDSSKLKS